MTGRGGRGQCREIIPSISDPLMMGKSHWPGAHAAPRRAARVKAARENETAFARQREKKKNRH